VVIAVVLAVVIGLSVFFKVDRVVVYGNDAYSPWTIQEASGIEGGENLLSFGRTRACGKIITALPYVKTVRIGIKLPDTVNIYVEEFDVSYAIEDTNGGWWLMTSSGKIAEQIDKAKSNSYTKVEGVTLVGPVVGEQAVAYEIFTPEETENETVSTEETTPVVTVTSNDRLQAALLILESLEANDIVGEISMVNVESIYNLEMMYGQRYQVKLGTTSDMDYKISMMKASVAQLNEYQAGILDVSFTTYTEGPFYTPLA
jgi:cell division septal protein FtsQ